MRFGLVVDALDPAGPLDDLIRQAAAAEQAGFDLVWLPELAGSIPSPAVAAAALAPHTSSVHVAVELQAGVNPVYLAEEAAVADLCLGGRLVLAVTSDDADLLAETADVLLAATSARPFRHEGTRWQIPANLPENVVNREERVRVTPATAQLELPIWLSGPAAPEPARERCLTHVGSANDSTESVATEWQRTAERLGRAADRLRRVAVRALPSSEGMRVDTDALVDRLRADQCAWGMDIALIQFPHQMSQPDRLRTLDAIAAHVMPRVQLDRLPPGLEQHWKQRQETAG